MHLDIEEFLTFYDTALGRAVAKTLTRKLYDVAELKPHMKMLGLGYPTPFLNHLQKYTERTCAVMPEKQGVMTWPTGALNQTLMAEEDAFPFPDDFFDRLFIIHSLEFSDRPKRFLNEAWRVLAPEGKIYIVVPNRKGYWANFGHTPFGHGKPYTTHQIRKLLEQSSFCFTKRERALFFPPIAMSPVLRAATTWEKAGAQFYSVLSGILIIEAEKKIAAPLHGKAAMNNLVKKPILGSL